jgi:hypothetical protein
MNGAAGGRKTDLAVRSMEPLAIAACSAHSGCDRRSTTVERRMSALIFKIVKHDGAWAVEHDGRLSNRAKDKAEVVASATKLARAAVGQGRIVQVRVEGETGYF